jgi:hypothetical protein
LLQEAADLFGIGLDILHEQLAREEHSRLRRRGQKEAAPAAAPGQAVAAAMATDGVRSFAVIDRGAIEDTMLAHVLRDGSGLAAEVLLEEGTEDLLTAPAARALWSEVVGWREARDGGRPSTPARFVQERWHQKDGSYRQYVSDLLTKEVVPDHTDFARVIRDCLQRLRDDPRRRQH